jgi:hypothetical protein
MNEEMPVVYGVLPKSFWTIVLKKRGSVVIPWCLLGSSPLAR